MTVTFFITTGTMTFMMYLLFLKSILILCVHAYLDCSIT